MPSKISQGYRQAGQGTDRIDTAAAQGTKGYGGNAVSGCKSSAYILRIVKLSIITCSMAAMEGGRMLPYRVRGHIQGDFGLCNLGTFPVALLARHRASPVDLFATDHSMRLNERALVMAASMHQL